MGVLGAALAIEPAAAAVLHSLQTVQLQPLQLHLSPLLQPVFVAGPTAALDVAVTATTT